MRFITLCLPALVCGALGCTSSSRLATCQAEKEQLLTTIRGQRDSNRALNDQVASLESRLDQAEKELARAGTGTRLSSNPGDTPPGAKAATGGRGPDQPQTARSDSLPWRAPAKTEFASTPTPTRSVSEGSLPSSGVQIYLLDSDAPVVGWSSEPLRR